MHCRSLQTLSLGPSKFQNYDPLTTTRVHTQLNYKRKLQVDQTTLLKPEVLSVRSARTIITMCMENADPSRCVNTNEY